MTIKERIQGDIKAAMLSGDKQTTQALQGLKSAILYAEVESGQREEGLSEDAVQAVLTKELKKRQESIDLYRQGGNDNQAAAEQREKEIIESYLPKQLDTEELTALVDATIAKIDAPISIKDMGKIITQVKQQTGATADGAVIAQLVKERIS